jgi:DNA-binding CsgD family transcriptional regulator
MKAGWGLASPLSEKQKIVWSLLGAGLSAATVASKLGSTRQFVNQTKLAAEAKLSASLLDAAQANHLQTIRLDSKKGILLGYHPGIDRKAVVTYSIRYGIKVWYWYDNPEAVTDKEFLGQTRRYLLELAKERHINTSGLKSVHPGKLAQFVFSDLVPELKE